MSGTGGFAGRLADIRATANESQKLSEQHSAKSVEEACHIAEELASKLNGVFELKVHPFKDGIAVIGRAVWTLPGEGSLGCTVMFDQAHEKMYFVV